MPTKHILDDGRYASSQRTGTRHRLSASRGADLLPIGRAGGKPHTEAIATWEGEGGSLRETDPGSARRPERERPPSTASSDGRTTQQDNARIQRLSTAAEPPPGEGSAPVHRNSVSARDASAQIPRPQTLESGAFSEASGHHCSRCDDLLVDVVQITQALQLKEAVLQEMHHRVKNTLQIAASLLSLQFHADCPADARTALRAAFDRLHALAAVHEMLSLQATTSGTIAMRPLLNSVASALERSFPEKSARVELRVSADDVSPAVDQAIPLALFANEAITNAYRHAFPEGVSGEIVADLSRTTDAVVLQVSDSGVGMPQSNRKEGLGTRLIHRLAQQLGATISCTTVDGAGGTVLKMSLPIGALGRVGQRAAIKDSATYDAASRSTES